MGTKIEFVTPAKLKKAISDLPCTTFYRGCDGRIYIMLQNGSRLRLDDGRICSNLNTTVPPKVFSKAVITLT